MKRYLALVLTTIFTMSSFGMAEQQGTSANATKHKKAVRKQTTNISEELAEMKAMLQQQQRRIDELQQQLQQRDQAMQQTQQQASQAQTAASEAASKAEAASAAARQSVESLAAVKTDVSDVKANATTTALSIQEDQKTVSSVRGEVAKLSRLKFSGDLRLRFEPFFGGGAATAAAPQNRFRERYRLRFNVNTKISDDFAAGLSLASGDLGDPVSTNSTLTGFYTRKPIAIDKAYGVYNPHNFKPLTITAGKFGYTWQRTELTWDNDLNPEGASEQLAWDWKGKVFSHFAVIGFETPIFEAGGGPDTYMTGGQVQTGWTFGNRIKFGANAAYYDFGNPDTIVQNQGQTPGNGLATQGTSNTGGGNFGFSASTLTNNFGVIGGKRVFASKYGIFDAIGRLDIDTGNKRWPVYALVDYIQNTRACSNLGAFVAAGVTAPTCDGNQRHGYWAELKAGQTKNKGDILVGYTFARIERDAVLSAFDFSDLRQPTNVLMHRIEAGYQLHPHVQLFFTGLIGRQIVTAQSPNLERWLKRFQFDTIFTF